MHKLKEYMCDELDELERKVEKGSKLSKSDIEDVKLLAKSYNELSEAERCMEEEYSMGMSGRGYSRRGGSYSMRGSYADSERSMAGGDFVKPDGSYRGESGASYARGRRGNVRRDAMGRYSSADEMADGLMMLAEKAPDEKTRREIMELMERI